MNLERFGLIQDAKLGLFHAQRAGEPAPRAAPTSKLAATRAEVLERSFSAPTKKKKKPISKATKKPPTRPAKAKKPAPATKAKAAKKKPAITAQAL